jgi:hypothetical protein
VPLVEVGDIIPIIKYELSAEVPAETQLFMYDPQFADASTRKDKTQPKALFAAIAEKAVM